MTEKNKKRDKFTIKPQVKSLFHAELDGNKNRMNLVFSGVNSVKDYSDRHLLLRFRGFYIKLSGEGLRLFVFEDGSISLEGRIEGLEFLYDRNC